MSAPCTFAPQAVTWKRGDTFVVLNETVLGEIVAWSRSRWAGDVMSAIWIVPFVTLPQPFDGGGVGAALTTAVGTDVARARAVGVLGADDDAERVAGIDGLQHVGVILRAADVAATAAVSVTPSPLVRVRDRLGAGPRALRGGQSLSLGRRYPRSSAARCCSARAPMQPVRARSRAPRRRPRSRRQPRPEWRATSASTRCLGCFRSSCEPLSVG